MLIPNLKRCEIISNAICNKCEENGFAAEISASIEAEDIVIIKVDAYYNSLPREYQIASPDCLIIVKCSDGSHRIYIVELRDIKDKNGFNVYKIREKFKNCINHFMKDVLREYFFDEEISYKRLNLVFVSDPYDQTNSTGNERPGKNTKMDALLALSAGEPFSFDGRKWCIQHAWQNPLVTAC